MICRRRSFNPPEGEGERGKEKKDERTYPAIIRNPSSFGIRGASDYRYYNLIDRLPIAKSSGMWRFVQVDARANGGKGKVGRGWKRAGSGCGDALSELVENDFGSTRIELAGEDCPKCYEEGLFFSRKWRILLEVGTMKVTRTFNFVRKILYTTEMFLIKDKTEKY